MDGRTMHVHLLLVMGARMDWQANTRSLKVTPRAVNTLKRSTASRKTLLLVFTRITTPTILLLRLNLMAGTVHGARNTNLITDKLLMELPLNTLRSLTRVAYRMARKTSQQARLEELIIIIIMAII